MLKATGASNPGIVARNDNLAIAVKIMAKISAKISAKCGACLAYRFSFVPPFLEINPDGSVRITET
ncbi:MAG TPA: hypothetical protein VGJ72_04230 [Polaromonas sp.]